ncbi:ABC transporter ATP-binding protein [Aeromicrobium sp. 9AM]|nr:ABC transporter ATP-binding protein [Aeromicrobium sp. 9AM]
MLTGVPREDRTAWKDNVALFELKDLTVDVHGPNGDIRLADGISLSVEAGETLCVVGESGSGKSVTMLSAMRLLEFTAPLTVSGSAVLGGTDLLSLSQQAMTAVRGHRVGMVFQEAMDALNPTQTVMAQLCEAYLLSNDLGRTSGRRERAAQRSAARRSAMSLVKEVGLEESVADLYPHQMSGGMQQRIMIAMALMGEPEMLIADEPTTALDVTVQAEILKLLQRLQRDRQMSCVFVTHDMGVAAEISDRIAVLYAGQVVEIGPTSQILGAPQHPYTKALLECVPRPNTRLVGLMRTIPGSVPEPGHYPAGDRFAPRNALASQQDLDDPPPVVTSADGRHSVRAWRPVEHWTDEMVDALTGHPGDQVVAERSRPAGDGEPVVVLENVSKTYGTRPVSGWIRRVTHSGREGKTNRTRAAVAGVNLTVYKGEFFGVVGETGSGKSTLGKLMLDLEQADAGSKITVSGLDLGQARGLVEERQLRRHVQMVFQNPQDTLDPRRSVADAIAEPLWALTDLGREGVEARVREMLEAVRLPSNAGAKFASELSGGQRQRVAIARAIAPGPDVVVADEPTSALDVSVQGQVMNLLLELQRELNLTYVFITHNLSLVTSVADRVGVMRRGELVEVLTADELIAGASHPYTRALAAANPDPFKGLGAVASVASTTNHQTVTPIEEKT